MPDTRTGIEFPGFETSAAFVPRSGISPADSAFRIPASTERAPADMPAPGSHPAPDSQEARLAAADRLLASVFGFGGYRSFQREIISATLAFRDVLAVLPTGGGKSLCYQLPALVFPGFTLVVSPLIALMRDQIDALLGLGIPAVFLNSTLDPAEYMAEVARVIAGEVKLVYAAPEGIASGRLSILLDRVAPSLLVVDEAHCISEWGHDFRPDYRRIASLRERFPEIPCLAVTATAPGRVRQDIASNLGLRDPALFVAGFDRPNLQLSVEPRKRAKERILEIALRDREASGIVYCGSRAKTEDFAEFLRSYRVSAVAYHAGLAKEERDAAQRAFIRDDVQVVAATVAFGMGIDKPDVRWIIHADLPASMESYYQEIGRAGRDGLPARCILLYSRGDEIRSAFLFEGLEDEQRELAMRRLGEMVRYARSESCRRRIILAHFGERLAGYNCASCDVCLRDHGPLVDYTLPALKLLSCVVRAASSCTASGLVDILLGLRTDEIEGKGHDKLSTFGIGTDLSRAAWMELARILQSQGYLQADSAGRLGLSGPGKELLRSRGPFHALPLAAAKLIKKAQPATSPAIKAAASPTAPAKSGAGFSRGRKDAQPADTEGTRGIEGSHGTGAGEGTGGGGRRSRTKKAGSTEIASHEVASKKAAGKGARTALPVPAEEAQGAESGTVELPDEALYHALRRKRKELADAASLPPYVIFPDRTLSEFVRLRPGTLAAMRNVFGVGDTKLARYGEDFLAVIAAFPREPEA